MLQPVSAAPTRVLMTLDAVGGVWRYAMDLGTALTGAGIELVFAGFGPAPSPELAREAEALGPLHWHAAPLDWTAREEAELDPVGPAIATLARRYGVDLVHLNLPSQAAGLEVRCPVVVVSHSCVLTWFRAVRGTGVPHDWAWQVKRNRAGFERADAVVAPSRSHARALADGYGDLPPVSVVPNAIPPVPGRPGPREPFALAAGRWWDEGKNGTVLDGAAGMARLRVRMAGPLRGPSGQSIELHYAQALGELPNGAVRDLMGRAAVFVSPSVYEPFGLAVLEAAQAGAALVLSDIPSYRENWDGAALFAPPRDTAAFARILEALADDSGLSREMGRLASVRAEAFAPEIQARAMLDVYRGLGSAAERPLSAVG